MKLPLSLRYTGLLTFLTFLFCGLGYGADASAATYYMRADGTAVNKAAATGPCTTASAAMSIATHNSQTFSADDIILLCNNGGNYTTTILTVPSSGTSGHPIIYRNAPTQTVTLDATGIARSMYMNAKSDITIDGLNFQNGTSNNVSADGVTNRITVTGNTFTGASSIALLISAGTGVVVSNNTFTQSGVRSLHFYNSTTNYVTNSSVTGNTFTGVTGKTGLSWIVFDHADGLTLSNNTISNYSTGAGAKIITFNVVNGATVSGNTLTGNSGRGFQYESGTSIVSSNNSINTQGENAYTYNNTTATLNSDSGDHVAAGPIFNVVGTSVMTCNNCVARYASYVSGTGSGYFQQGSAAFTCNNCTADHNQQDGFNSNNTGSLTCNRCSSHNNGSLGDQSAGDGYTSHDTSTLNVRYSLAYDNYKSGAAVTGGSSGEIKNCTFYNNYESSLGSGWDSTGDIGIGINATGTWVIKNNITQGHPVEMMISAAAITGGATITSDYNDFYSALGDIAFDYNGTLYNFSNYKALSGKDTHSLNQNPLLTAPASQNFTLQSGSPAIGAGTSLGITPDYAGNPVPSGSATDMGAYEFQDTTAPTTSANVSSGTYNSAQSVTLTCDDGAGVGCSATYYTTDGTTPTTGSTQYTTPITISVTTTLKFFSKDTNGNTETPVVSRSYTIDPAVPEVSEDADEYESADIDSFKAYQYRRDSSCETKLRLEIKGKHFSKNAVVEIDGKEASSVDRRSSKYLVATFCLKNLLNAKKDTKRTVTVTNPHTDEEKANKKIDLTKVSYKFTFNELHTGNKEGIMMVERALYQLGFLQLKDVNGFYNQVMRNAIIVFQKQHGVPATGFFGPLTKAALWTAVK